MIFKYLFVCLQKKLEQPDGSTSPLPPAFFWVAVNEDEKTKKVFMQVCCRKFYVYNNVNSRGNEKAPSEAARGEWMSVLDEVIAEKTTPVSPIFSLKFKN